MNILTKNKLSGTEKVRSSVMGVEPTTAWPEVQRDNHSAIIAVNF